MFGGGAAADSGDFDMSAQTLIGHGIYLLANFLIVRAQNIGFTGVRGAVQDDICV